MTELRRVFELARRDFITRARSRAFVISMVAIIGVIVAAGPLITLVTDEDTPSATVGIVTGAPQTLPDIIVLQGEAAGIDIRTRSLPDSAVGEAALEDEELAVLINGPEIVWRAEPWATLRAVVISSLQVSRQAAVATELGLSTGDVNRLLRPVEVSERRVVAEDPEEEPRRVAALIGMMMLYISIIVFGQFVLMGVMEEKQNRVVEVVLSRASPVQVLTAKVIGIGLLGLIQVVAVGAAIVFTASLVDLTDIDLGAIGIDTVVPVIGWFLIGYAFYSVMYGGLGATVSRQEDVQGVVLLPVLCILPGFFVAQIALLEPSSTLVRVGSLLPLWSPMVMSVRSAVSNVPAWELVLSIALLLLSTVLLVRVAARIYTGAVLRIGRKVRLGDAWRAAAD
jgi:ABC-2 type transport system permease protein